MLHGNTIALYRRVENRLAMAIGHQVDLSIGRRADLKACASWLLNFNSDELQARAIKDNHHALDTPRYEWASHVSLTDMPVEVLVVARSAGKAGGLQASHPPMAGCPSL